MAELVAWYDVWLHAALAIVMGWLFSVHDDAQEVAVQPEHVVPFRFVWLPDIFLYMHVDELPKGYVCTPLVVLNTFGYAFVHEPPPAAPWQTPACVRTEP